MIITNHLILYSVISSPPQFACPPRGASSWSVVRSRCLLRVCGPPKGSVPAPDPLVRLSFCSIEMLWITRLHIRTHLCVIILHMSLIHLEFGSRQHLAALGGGSTFTAHDYSGDGEGACACLNELWLCRSPSFLHLGFQLFLCVCSICSTTSHWASVWDQEMKSLNTNAFIKMILKFSSSSLSPVALKENEKTFCCQFTHISQKEEHISVTKGEFRSQYTMWCITSSCVRSSTWNNLD